MDKTVVCKSHFVMVCSCCIVTNTGDIMSQYLDVFTGWTIAVRFQAGAEIISPVPPHPG